MSVIDEILAIYARRGALAYFGEEVSTTEHSLQAAYFAQQSAATPSLVVAALLHDIGHLVEEVPDDIADWTVDGRHEQIGGRWLAQRFEPQVSEPVRLHVPAKRYLCATDAGYFAKLSPASVLTLQLQGGPMSAREAAEFECERYYREAVRIRQWDDQGKIAGLATPSLSDYRALIEGNSSAPGDRSSGFDNCLSRPPPANARHPVRSGSGLRAAYAAYAVYAEGPIEPVAHWSVRTAIQDESNSAIQGRPGHVRRSIPI